MPSALKFAQHGRRLVAEHAPGADEADADRQHQRHDDGRYRHLEHEAARAAS